MVNLSFKKGERTAKTLFRDIGYNKYTEVMNKDSDFVKGIEYRIDNERRIEFDLTKRNINIDGTILGIEDINAIQKQIKELGWI